MLQPSSPTNSLAPVAIAAVIALGSAALTGFIDLHNTQVQAAIIVMAPGAFIAGMLSPRLFWLWAIVIGLGVPAAHVWARATGFVVPYPVQFGWTLLALIPAFVFCGIGAAVRFGFVLAASGSLTAR